MKQKKLLFISAVDEEKTDINVLGYECDYLITNIGKVNAAIQLTKKLMQINYDLIINVGTAGTITHKVGDILACQYFFDRDYKNIKELGITNELDFSRDPMPLPLFSIINGSKEACTFSVSTGDNFVTKHQQIEGDVIDMESFAIASVCKEFHKKFLSIKYITDVVGDNSVEAWQKKCKDAREGFKLYFEELNKEILGGF